MVNCWNVSPLPGRQRPQGALAPPLGELAPPKGGD